MGTPNCRRQLKVDAQSALVAKLSSRDSPSAIAEIIAARCEMDLSPGSTIEPFTEFAGQISISSHSSVPIGYLS
jgi:hypothetical protein